MFRGKVFNSRVCRLVYFFLFCRSKRSNVRGQINRETDRTAGIGCQNFPNCSIFGSILWTRCSGNDFFFFYPLYLLIFSMVYLEDNPRQVFFTIRAGFRLVDLY